MWRIWSVLCEKDAVTKGKRKVDSHTIYFAPMELAGKKEAGVRVYRKQLDMRHYVDAVLRRVKCSVDSSKKQW